METKICSKCSIEKSVDGFHKDKGKKDGLNAYCKECANEQSNLWNQDFRENNPEEYKQKSRIAKFRNYGLTW